MVYFYCFIWLSQWRSLLKLRHCTTYLTAFTNLTVQLQKQILQSCLQMLFQASLTGTIALVVPESGQSSYTITLLRQHTLFCTSEPVSPGTSLVTHDKIPPTESFPIARSRDIPQYNRYFIHTAKSKVEIFLP